MRFQGVTTLLIILKYYGMLCDVDLPAVTGVFWYCRSIFYDWLTLQIKAILPSVNITCRLGVATQKT
jgi:hypothetical protein